MGYQEKKLIADKKWRKFKIVLIFIFLFMAVSLGVFSFFVPPKTWKYHVGKPNINKKQAGEMRIHFLDVGQGDCTLIELPDGKTLLLDGGDGRERTSKTILRYLNALNIDIIDYLVVSHADSDHCGGLDVILKNKKVLAAYLPPAYPTVNTEYSQAYSAILDEKCAIHLSSMKQTLSVTDSSTPYTLAFLYPNSLDVTEENWENNENNDQSCVLWLDYQGVSALFMGDSPFSTETQLMRRDALDVYSVLNVDLSSTEILKVAHHGSSDSTGLDFLNHLHTQTAVISCGAENLYGHPSDEVLTRLETVGAQVFRTDEQGHIVITASSETGYTVKCVA